MNKVKNLGPIYTPFEPFQKELTNLINVTGLDNYTNIPDHILSDMIVNYIRSESYYIDQIKRWFGVDKDDCETKYKTAPNKNKT